MDRWSTSQKKSAAVGRAGAGAVLRGVPAHFLFRARAASGAAADFNTPNLGFCRGSKGTREDPSGLTWRLRSVFLNSESTAEVQNRFWAEPHFQKCQRNDRTCSFIVPKTKRHFLGLQFGSLRLQEKQEV